MDNKKINDDLPDMSPDLARAFHSMLLLTQAIEILAKDLPEEKKEQVKQILGKSRYYTIQALFSTGQDEIRKEALSEHLGFSLTEGDDND